MPTSHNHPRAASGHAPVRRSRWTPLRTGAAVAAGLVVTTAVAASAASLGTVTSDTLGAGTTTVASCDTDGVNLSYTNTYVAGAYNVTAVTVSGVNSACIGRTLGITLTGAANANVGTVTPLVLSATNLTAGVTAPLTLTTTTTAASVTGAAVVIA